MRLSCAEIRRLFWQLAIAVEQTAVTILRWSWWRRWHQAWARYHHYRRRNTPAAAERAAAASAAGASEQEGADDVIDVVWKRLLPLLPPDKRVGHPFDHDRRVILQAIVHVMRSGCGWRNLPDEFPPWQTVYSQYAQWRTSGIWDTIWAGLSESRPTR